jgi:hypothetical protein
MSILNKVEDWIMRNTLEPFPVSPPPSDDGVLALLMFTGFLLVVGITCGRCLAR